MATQQIFMEPVSAQTQTKSVGLDLGTIRYEGSKIHQYIYNSGGAAISAGYACILSGTGSYSATVTSTTRNDVPFGIAENAISATAYGWVLKKGITTFIAGTTTSFAVGDRLVLGTDGTMEAASAVTYTSTSVGPMNVVGYTISAVASAASGLGYFAFP
jgi:hypothetical protein